MQLSLLFAVVMRDPVDTKVNPVASHLPDWHSRSAGIRLVYRAPSEPASPELVTLKREPRTGGLEQAAAACTSANSSHPLRCQLRNATAFRGRQREPKGNCC